MPEFPSQFSDLQLYSDWSMSTEQDRIKEIDSRSDDDLRSFYDAVFPRMAAIVSHLNKYPLKGMPETEAALFDLAKMMIEVATVVEHGRSIIGQYFDVRRFVPLNEMEG